MWNRVLDTVFRKPYEEEVEDLVLIEEEKEEDE